MSARDRLTSLGDSDRGASAILVAAALVMLMGFAALAVDSGIGFNDRRQQASAADVGALAALQFAKTTLTATHPDCTGLTGKRKSACRGAEEAIAVIDGTLPGRYDDAAWGACVDANPPVEYTTGGGGIVSAISPCISFTNSLRRARVVLPGTDVETAFGKVIGVSSIRVSAFAEAGLEMNISGGVLPFALGPSAASSNQACFFTQDSPGLNIEPCTGSTQGNFGKLDIRWYGNELYEMGGASCSGQNAWRMTANIIAGTDHPLEPHWKTTPGIVNDNSNCNNIANPVDEIETWTGNAAGAIADGLIHGMSSPKVYEGRIRCKDGAGNEDYPAFEYSSSACVTVNGSNHPGTLDHTPLWDFLDWNNGACNASINDRDDMATCLAHYNMFQPKQADGITPVPLFTPALATSPRFGGVPELHSDPLPGASNPYRITGFKPVYLETMYYRCTGPTKCDTVHSPGENTDGSPPAACPDPITPATSSCGWPATPPFNKGIEAITAFILTLDMLPDEIGENFPYQDGTIVYNLHR